MTEHLASVAGLSLLLTLLGCQAPYTEPRQDIDASTPPRAPSSSNTDPQDHGIDGHELTSAPPTADAVTIAEHFAHAWTSQSPDAKTWRDTLTPMCEPGFAATLSQIDPANTPRPRIVGPAHLTPQDNGQPWAAVELPADAGTLILTVAPIEGRWLISGIDFRRSTS